MVTLEHYLIEIIVSSVCFTNEFKVSIEKKIIIRNFKELVLYCFLFNLVYYKALAQKDAQNFLIFILNQDFRLNKIY